MNKAVFLDRDGVINEVKTDRVKFVNRPEDLYILDGVPEAIKQLNDAGFKVFVVTNQGGVGLGYMTEDELNTIHDHMARELAKQGAHIHEIMACTHAPHENCYCRKPGSQMLLDLIDDYDVDIMKSYLVGDREPDIEAGNAVGIKSLMVVSTHPEAYKSFNDLSEAVEWILEDEKA
ncbi:D-glycero-alpha-D-manno-heptose-1,7-bisphosphate 7-phosphatase [Aquisalibacillus elongatus]|uniref:D-glycero-alpha-D-manno-heptose-1,7-bisphosphate 7-phosphatase n=1 Tax=Aquisalibacillus elongatus TaxID=485577 RepID=UPI000F544314|nr:HAD family hydrolase [Aquisalibacillus elongatus]